MRPNRQPVARQTPSLPDERIAALKNLFPEAVTEGEIDLDKLRTLLGEEVDDRPERYTFSWAGKRDAIRMLQTPSAGTLVPCEEESIDFEDTQNVLIEGENLEVLKLLYKAYAGRVKMIYIDPPYNTGNDFIYPDNYADPLDTYLRLTGQKDAEGNLLTSNPETSGRYHSAWLSMMYPRLVLARQLLREDGVIFISIDDHEVHNLRMLMNEVFGEENFVATMIWQKVYSPKSTARHFSEDHDYIVVYARDAQVWQPNLLPRTEEMDARYGNPDNDPRGPWKPSGLDARNYYSRGIYQIMCPSGRVIPGPPPGSYWRVSEERFKELDRDNRIWWGEDGNSVPSIKRFLSEVKPGKVPQTLWAHSEVGHTQEAKKELLDLVEFQRPENVLHTLKPIRLMRRMLQLATEPRDRAIVVDFFAGSASTAQAVLTHNRTDGGNRQFVMVQLPEPLPKPKQGLSTIADIGKERIRRVIARMKDEDARQLDLSTRETPEDLGFRVFKLASSNYRPWRGTKEATPEAYADQMELFTDPLVEGWNPRDVIWEVAIKGGYSLDSRIERVQGAESQTVFRVTDPDREQSFFICLDDGIRLEKLRSLQLNADTLFICRDVALNDETAANLALQCRLKTM